MNNLALKKAIATELDFVRHRVEVYSSKVSSNPDIISDVKMLSYYQGQLEVLTFLSYFTQEVNQL